MTVPANAVNVQGIGSVTADNLNTFIQNVQTAVQLRAFIGVTGMAIFLDGISAPGAGGAGWFYWNATGTAADDNKNIIKPTNAAQGEWVRLVPGFTAAIAMDLDGAGSVPGAGVVRDVYVPFSCTISSWVIQADQTGSIVIDVWKTPFTANTPPTGANSITGTALPTLTAAESALSSTLTGWTTQINAGDWLRFNLNSIATITKCTLTLVVNG